MRVLVTGGAGFVGGNVTTGLLPLATGIRRRGPPDCGRIGREAGWSPDHDLAAGIGAYLDWLRASDDPEGTR